MTKTDIRKTHIVKNTSVHAPFSHNLVLLLGRSGISASENLVLDLQEITKFNIEGRYPEEVDALKKSLTKEKVAFWEKKAKVIMKFFDQQH